MARMARSIGIWTFRLRKLESRGLPLSVAGLSELPRLSNSRSVSIGKLVMLDFVTENRKSIYRFAQAQLLGAMMHRSRKAGFSQFRIQTALLILHVRSTQSVP